MTAVTLATSRSERSSRKFCKFFVRSVMRESSAWVSRTRGLLAWPFSPLSFYNDLTARGDCQFAEAVQDIAFLRVGVWVAFPAFHAAKLALLPNIRK